MSTKTPWLSGRCNQELELELLKMDPSGSAVTPLALSTATDTLNSRIRHQGLSAKEVVFGRDQFTGEKLVVDGASISKRQDELRKSNHVPSARSKARKKQDAVDAAVNVGDLVYIEHEGGKHNPRERYIVTKIVGSEVVLQKMNSSSLSSKKYEVPLTHLLPVVDKGDRCSTPRHVAHLDSDTSTEEEFDASESAEETDGLPSESDAEDDMEDEDPGPRPVPDHAVRRSVRNRRQPAWLRSTHWAR
jgi:hypothetical protein